MTAPQHDPDGLSPPSEWDGLGRRGLGRDAPLDRLGERLFGEGPAVGDRVRWLHPWNDNPDSVGVITAAWLLGDLPTYRVAWPGGGSNAVGVEWLVLDSDDAGLTPREGIPTQVCLLLASAAMVPIGVVVACTWWWVQAVTR